MEEGLIMLKGVWMQRGSTRRLLPLALLLALCLLLLSPAVASAHAILVRSDPARDAVLKAAPQQVRMWFTEDLNPAFTTAAVINAASQRVDLHDAHVSPGDSKEMDLTLASNLPAAVYVVLYRTDSADDGHILRGSFIFSVERPDGSVPRLQSNIIPGEDLLGGTGANPTTGELDGPTLFNLAMISLLELAGVFWVAAQLWVVFIFQLLPAGNTELAAVTQRIRRRFDQHLALPTLLVLLVAQVGVLVAQALSISGGQWGKAFDPQLLTKLATSGRFGTYWLLREATVAVALALACSQAVIKQRLGGMNNALPMVNLLLGLTLFFAVSMSSHAAAVSSNVVVFAILSDWLHLLAAALWVGGMFYLATTVLPIIGQQPITLRARFLLTILARFSPLAFAGVALMAVTGPFSATTRLNAWQQLLTTSYGRTLSVKIALVGALVLTSAIHVFLMRPRLAREQQKHQYISEGLHFDQVRQVKLREERLTTRTQRLMGVLRWEPVLGVGVLLCVGLLNVFAGTITPITSAPLPQQQSAGKAQPFVTTIKTSDNLFTVRLSVDPNRFGTNVFTATVSETRTGKPATHIGVALYTTMLDMDMGTESVDLLPDGKGHFSASGDLSMGGNWQIRIQIRTLDGKLHETHVKLFTPF